MTCCKGFAPIIPSHPKIIVLGTMPSVVSIDDAFYYAHPRNAFWPIMSSFINRPLWSREDKIRACNQLGVLVWDVLQGCERKGSLDSAIKAPVANDFGQLLSDFREIKIIAFNGKVAEKLFKKEVLTKQVIPERITFVSLPSTSPAYAAISQEDKRLLWQEKLFDLL